MLCLSGFELYSRWVALVYLPAQNYSYLPGLQNSPYFWVVKYARTVKQKVWNEGKTESETGERRLRACEARALCVLKTLTPRFTDFFNDFERKKPTVLQSTTYLAFPIKLSLSLVTCFSGSFYGITVLHTSKWLQCSKSSLFWPDEKMR